MDDRVWREGNRGPPLRLKDGTPCRIRPIGRDDKDFLTRCFSGLSAESRRMRFFGAKSVLSEHELAFLASADGCDHIALGAVRLDAHGVESEPLGVARCIRLTPGSDTCELAIAVIDSVQGRGIGGLLLTHLVEVAGRQGIRRFHCEVLAANKGMRALAGGLGSDVHWHDDGTLEYGYELPPPPPESPDQAPDLMFPGRLCVDVWSAGFERLFDVSLELCRDLSNEWLSHWAGGARFDHLD